MTYDRDDETWVERLLLSRWVGNIGGVILLFLIGITVVGTVAFLIWLCFAILGGESHSVSIDDRDWVCIETGTVYHPAGGAKIHHEAYTTRECMQWSRRIKNGYVDKNLEGKP